MVRREDGEPANRRRGVDPLTTWVVGVVLAGIVSALGFLAIEDRRSFDSRLAESAANRRAIEARVTATEAQIAAMQAGQAFIAASLQRIEDKIDRHERSSRR